MSDQVPHTAASCGARLQYPWVRKWTCPLPGLEPARPGGHALLEEGSRGLDEPLAGIAEPDLPLAMLHHGPPRAEQGALGAGPPLLVVEVVVNRGTHGGLASMLFLVPGLQEQV